MELLSKLGINWQLLIAQIVNFAILVGVLSVLVYKPLLKLLDTRSERIRKAMADSERIERENKETETKRAAELKKIDQESGQLLAQARKLAESAKEEMIASAKKEAEQIVARAKMEIAQEKARLLSDVQASVADMIVKLTEKLIEREFTSVDQKRLLASIAKDLPALTHAD